MRRFAAADQAPVDTRFASVLAPSSQVSIRSQGAPEHLGATVGVDREVGRWNGDPHEIEDLVVRDGSLSGVDMAGVLEVITVAPRRAAVLGVLYALVEAGAPNYLEWYLAFSLMVTLIWLYITLLQLIALLTRNR